MFHFEGFVFRNSEVILYYSVPPPPKICRYCTEKKKKKKIDLNLGKPAYRL